MEAPQPAPGQVLVATSCWSCGAQLFKSVPRRRRGGGHVSWICPDCDIMWSAPGTEASRVA